MKSKQACCSSVTLFIGSNHEFLNKNAKNMLFHPFVTLMCVPNVLTRSELQPWSCQGLCALLRGTLAEGMFADSRALTLCPPVEGQRLPTYHRYNTPTDFLGILSQLDKEEFQRKS